MRVLCLAAALLVPIPMLAQTTIQAPTQTAATASPFVDDNPKAEKRWQKSIEADLVEEKFDDLDAMAAEYRRDHTRMAGGDLRLHLFYELLDAPQLTDKDSVDHLEHLEHWVKARPESITARVALATSLARWAWVARGHATADKTSAEAFQLYTDRMARSYQTLQGAQDMRVMCPQWYLEMLAVSDAMSFSSDKRKEVFQRGIQFDPSYFYLYDSYVHFLMPKWFGEPGDAAKFAVDAADKVGGSEGDILYFRMGSTLLGHGNGDFPARQLDWVRIQRGYAAQVAEYGVTKRAANQLAWLAWRFKDVAVAQKQFALIGDDWARGVWKERAVFDRTRDWSRGRNG